MGAWQYVALDTGGRERKGVLEGDNARHVRQLLRDQQLMPVSVDEVEEKTEQHGTGFSLKRGLGSLDLALITRQLATLLHAGLPLEEALHAVSEQTEKARIQSIILGVRASVLEGLSLARGFDEFPRAFPGVYRATVDAGEQAGQLDAVLERLADYTESRHSLKQKVSQAMIYPIVLTILALSIVVGMLIFIVPRVVGVFENTGQQLPLLTQLLIALSEFLQNWWFAVIAMIAVAVFAARHALKNEAIRRRWHRTILRLPLFGRVATGVNTARFTRTLSIATSSGVPVLEALRISASVVENLPMRDAIEAASAKVREGAAIGRSLAQSKLFPPMTIHLISSGESSGELDHMLERAATHQENEMDSLIGMMLGVLEPVLIVFMGLIVLAIVMAILLPIFQINQLVG
jgi:general secretion pathway protein F